MCDWLIVKLAAGNTETWEPFLESSIHKYVNQIEDCEDHDYEPKAISAPKPPPPAGLLVNGVFGMTQVGIEYANWNTEYQALCNHSKIQSGTPFWKG